MQSQITITKLLKMKQEGKKIAATTAYDYSFGKIADDAGIHMILVGDSLGMVMQGESTTLPVTMDQMVYHTKIVSRAVKNALVVGDMPFMSYQINPEMAIANAGRFLKETTAQAVKLEGGASVSPAIRLITNAGIPVQGHIGLTPQSVHQMGGYKVQRQEDKLIADALEVEKAGAFSVVLEGIPSDIAKKITEALKIPTIGIGAGPNCSGQILVIHDLLGIQDRMLPKFVKQYKKLGEIAKQGLQEYIEEVSSGKFPAKEHCYDK